MTAIPAFSAPSATTAPAAKLPVAARGALITLGIYVAISIVGIVQVYDLRGDVGRSTRELLDIIIFITAAMLFTMVAAGAALAAKRTATPLAVLSAIMLGLHIYSLRNGLNPAQLVSLVIVMVLVVQLRNRAVIHFFRARKANR
jgi:hypothetical protein